MGELLASIELRQGIASEIMSSSFARNAQQAFNQADTNKDGHLTQYEVVAVLWGQYEKPLLKAMKGLIKNMMKDFDEDQDKNLSLLEFTIAAKKLFSVHEYDQMKLE